MAYILQRLLLETDKLQALDSNSGGEIMICMYCRRDIGEGERRYYSRQAGMRGHYHWECFVDACRQANKVGQKEIESIAVSTGVYDNYSSFDTAEE